MFGKLILSANVIILFHLFYVKCDLDNAIHKDRLDTKLRYSDRIEVTKQSQNLKNKQNYADIQILDNNGQLKTLKLKSVKPKEPLKTVTIRDKMQNQVETPIVDKDGPSKNKSKFFDEFEGRKSKN